MLQQTCPTANILRCCWSCCHCTENHIFFFQTFWKDGLSKISHWNMIFFVLSGRMIFVFPENMILFIRRKIKDDLFQIYTWKYYIFFKCSEKMVFPKKMHWNMIFLVLSGKIVFFPLKTYFFFGRKIKDDLSQEIHKNMIFSVYMCICQKGCYPSAKKKSKMIFSNTLKGDWNSRLTLYKEFQWFFVLLWRPL